MTGEPATERTPAANTTSTAEIWTVVAIAAVAYVCASILHEGIGHGGACVLTGGKPVAISTVHFECDHEGRLVAAGGTIVNFAAGLEIGRAACRGSEGSGVVGAGGREQFTD